MLKLNTHIEKGVGYLYFITVYLLFFYIKPLQVFTSMKML